MKKNHHLKQVRELNLILSRIGGTDAAERATHAEAAFRYFAKQNATEAISLQRAAAALVKLHLELDSELAGRIAFEHWHAPDEAGWGGPLWIRPVLLRRLRQLTGAPAVLFLVTGLREAVCPHPRRWTQARRNEYARARNWIESIATRHHPTQTRIQMIVL